MSIPDKALKLKDGKIIYDQVRDMVATQFAQAMANDAGTYVVHNGQVYYLPNGHIADTTWENTTKVGPTNIGGELTGVKNAINILQPTATSSDIGKALIVKTVENGKPTSYEYSAAGGGGAEIDDTAGAGDTDKVWSASKTVSEIQQIIVSGGVPIDDTAEEGDIDKIWSADKSAKEFAKVGDNLTETAYTLAEASFSTGGYRRTTNGGDFAVSSSTDWYTSSLIELPDGVTSVKIRQQRPAGNATDPTKAGWSVVNFFNLSQTVISCQISNIGSADSDYTDNIYSVPSGAKYVSYITGKNYQAEVKCQIGITEETLVDRVETIESIVTIEKAIQIDESTLTTGVLYRDGDILASADYRTTDYIDCMPGDVFVLTSYGVSASYQWQVAYYDSDKHRLTFAYKGTGTSSLVTTNVEVPYSNARYIRFSFYKNGGISIVRKRLARDTTPDVVRFNEDAVNAVQQLPRRAQTGDTIPTDALTLLHFSDIHGDGICLKNIQSMKDYLAEYLDDTICTGDMVMHNYANGMGFWSNCDGKILTCIGNHEVLKQGSSDYSDQPTEANLYAAYISPYIASWGESVEHSSNDLFYYKDYAEKGFRLIVLNSLYADASRVTAQNTFLTNALAEAKTLGYAVVIAEHYYPNEAQKINCTFSSDTRFPTGTMDAKYQNNVASYQSIVQDFIDGGGEFVCYLCGHRHADYVAFTNGYQRQPFIGVAGALCYKNVNMAEGGVGTDSRRIPATKSMDTFNVISFDKSAHYIKIVRFGCDRDLYMKHKGTLVLNYSTSPATVVYND